MVFLKLMWRLVPLTKVLVVFHKYAIVALIGLQTSVKLSMDKLGDEWIGGRMDWWMNGE